LPAHLAAAGRLDDAVALVTDLGWVEAKCRAGLVFELQADYREILAALPEVQAERTEQRQRDARLERWTREIIEYARKWNDRLNRVARGETASEPEQPMPEVIASVPPWSNDRIETACRRIIEHPTRLDRLRAFCGFVQSECHSLLQFGSREGFVPQHALSCAPTGPVHEAATALLSRCRVPLVLRR
jgi:hypothetical protein